MGRRIPAVPAVAGALRPAVGNLPTEVFAGVTLAALCLPLNIGYAEAAGLPAVVGIYATIAPLVVYSFTAGSRRLRIGPDSTIAALMAATIGPIAISSGADPVALATATSLLTGLFLLLFWGLRLGSLVRFLSKSVLIGFIAGLALEVLLSQTMKIMGVRVEADGWFPEVWALLRAVPDASAASVAVGVGTIVALRVLRRVAPKLPAALIVLTGATIAVALIDPGGVSVLGDVPSGLPSLSVPQIPGTAWLDLVGTALAIAVLTIAEGLLIAKRTARAHGETLNPNAELIALGAANMAGAFTGAMPSGASASRTAAIEATGARSQVPSLVAAVSVVAIVLWFTDAVALLPTAALAGLVANAVVSTIEVAELRRLFQMRRTEFGIAIGCTLGVLILGPMAAIVVAAIASSVDVMRRAADAPWATLRVSSDDRTVARFAEQGETASPPGLVLVRPGGPLFFANADDLASVLGDAATAPEVEWVVLDMEQVFDLDPTAADALIEGIEAVQHAGRTVAIARAGRTLRELLDRHGITDVVGAGHLYVSNRSAEQAFLVSRQGQADDPS
ncbi:MAG: SulP family inorganic anion transporter [Ilumatobacteraceae bacterium]